MKRKKGHLCLVIAYDKCLLFCQQEVKVNSPDYRGMTSEEALEDFLQRIEHYMEQYQPLDEALEDHLSFMKVYNTGLSSAFSVFTFFSLNHKTS